MKSVVFVVVIWTTMGYVRFVTAMFSKTSKVPDFSSLVNRYNQPTLAKLINTWCEINDTPTFPRFVVSVLSNAIRFRRPKAVLL